MKVSKIYYQIILVAIITTQIQCVDKCFEYRIQKDCISSLDDQCVWENQVCSYTKNLQLGCSEFLNKKACLKQLAFSSGKLAKCIFNQFCQSASNFNQLNCQDNLSKHACMSIQKTSEMCYWDSLTYTCQYVQQNDDFQNFTDKLYSASVCGRIENYLIIHHTKLWELTSYTPNFIQQTEDIYRTDLGLKPETQGKSYDSGTIKNNYVNSQGYFQWYIQGQPLGSGLSNLKISDREREGCIALEIVDDDDYQMIFSQPIYEVGINHIYCRYQGAIFTRFKCLKLDNELQIRDSNFLAKNEIFCKYLDRNRCAYIQMECIPQSLNIDGQEKEFTCLDGLDNSKSGCFSEALDTFRKCQNLSGNEFCYLETVTNPPVCSQDCITNEETLCNIDLCNWTEYNEGFIGCVPKLGCKQPGINKNYCINIRLQCQWDPINLECYQLKDYLLNQMNCSEATTKFSCASIRTMGQECIWLDEEKLCLNILSDTLLKNFYSFPQRYSVNRELCMNSKGNHKYQQLYCVSYETEGTCNSEDSSQFNQDLCFNTKNCMWDVLNQVCIPLVLQNTCDLNVNVSSNACSQFANCKYNPLTNSCFTQASNLICDDEGLKKEVCLGLSSQACKWENNQCKSVNYFSSLCSSYRNISLKVCVLQETDKCMFASNQCILVETAPTDCNINLNRFACQFSTAACYFTGDTCATLTSTQQQTLTCQGYYLSKTACQKITRNNQQCYWDNVQCQVKPTSKYVNCSAGTSNSKYGCINIISAISKVPLDLYYCSYKLPDYACALQLKTDVIGGCGNPNLFPNQQSCVLLTNGNCIFVDQQCKAQPSDYASSKYWDYQLTNISCEQANVNICPKLKKGLCKIDTNRCITDQSSTKYDCTTYASSFSPFNYLICSNAVGIATAVKCKVKSDKTGCEVPSDTLMFTCKEFGINQKTCLESTYGQCAFINGICTSDLTQVTNCGQLNKWACLNSQLECTFTTTATTISCASSTQSKCPTSLMYNSWSLCQNKEQCYGYLGGCKTFNQNDSNPITKCNSPGIDQFMCEISLINCIFLQGACHNISQRKCEYELTKDECVNNLLYNCVYQNGICYTQDKLVACDSYQYTNQNFCRQYPNCYYTSNQCLDYSILAQSDNYNKIYAIKCQQYDNQFDCINQTNLKCKFQNVDKTCVPFSETLFTCPHQQNYSKIVCQQFQNCNLKFGYFCVDTTQNLNCSFIQDQNTCLSDIDDHLPCYWDGSICQNVTSQTCANVQSFQISFAGCKKVSNQDGQKCFYQNTSKKCKILKEVNSCSNYTTNIDCALRANASCLLGNPTSATTTCTSSTTYNINLNQYGCAQLTGAAYYYDIYTYTCLPIDLTKIQGCQNLNRVACTQSTSDALVIKCGWIDNQCQYLRDLTNITDCTILNKEACINIEISTLTCEWNVAAKTCAASAQTACYVPGSIPTSPTTLYSLSLCNKAGNTNGCMANYNYSGCITFSYTIELCSGMGLNKKACIQQTTGYCKWQNNQCQVSQLDNLNCNSDVNQNTCLMINNQMCQWNSSTYLCSDKIFTQCSDATNYNQCMNVPNQLCQYTDSCVQLIITPKICKAGYNKYSCTQVTDQMCTFDDNQCAVLSYVDNWKECSSLQTSDACAASSFSCQWVNSQCILQDSCEVTAGEFQCYAYTKHCLLNGCTSTKPLFCEQIYNKIACFESGFLCYWDDSTGCHTFKSALSQIDCSTYTQKVNRRVCQQFSSATCEYRDYLCTKLLSDNFYQTQTLFVISSSPVIVQSNCSAFLNQFDCTVQTDLECYWNTSCQSTTGQILTCTSNLSIQSCGKSGCIWRQRKCIDKSTYLFQPNEVLDEDIQDCNTKNISKLTCLNIQNTACTYQALTNQCIDSSFTLPNRKCSEYQLVNQKTCQSIPDQPCSYDQTTNNCIDFNGDYTMLDSLSKLACLSLNRAVYWNQGCYLTDSFNCDSAYEVTEASCKLAEEFCYFDQTLRKCLSEFNINSMLCTTPGLSQTACTSIIRQPCIFLEGSCQIITSDYICEQARSVNQLACQVQQNSCQYDAINKNCVTVSKSKICTTEGLSKSACLLNQSCVFNDDLYECQCYLVAQKNICFNLNKTQCLNKQYCIYDEDYSICRLERCEDLSFKNCKDYRLDMVCFLNNGVCQSARKCEDIINVDHSICDQIKFKSKEECIGINERCLNKNNYDLYCQLSDCSSQFCKKSNICEAKQCSELDDCTILGNKCILSQNQCVENISCQYLDSSKCGIKPLYNSQICQIQQYSIYESDNICTSQVCDLFGSSDLCNGNEFNNYTCIQKDSRCVPCEYITDACTCSAATNFCEWTSQLACKSIQCSQFDSADTCNTLSKCSWSEYYNQCTLHCSLIISQEDCDQRLNECYYDLANNLCQVGTYISPDLSVNIVLTTTFSKLFLPIFVIMMMEI